MSWAYDLDGTLCNTMPKPPKAWGKMMGTERNAWKQKLLQEYQKAVPLLIPPENQKFIVISARKNDIEVHKITLNWLFTFYKKNLTGLFLLEDSRSIENVVNFKTKILKNYFVNDFVEDNWQVVKGIRKLAPEKTIWHYKNGQLIK